MPLFEITLKTLPSPAELGAETVGDGLDFFYEDVADGKQAETDTIALRVYHAIHLVVDTVEQPIGVNGARDTEFLIGVAADTG